MNESELKGLEDKLWSAADKMRGAVSVSEYKFIVLGLIFLKYISDSFEERYKELVEEGYGLEEEKDSYTEKNIFYVPKNARWEYLVKHSKDENIGEIIDDALTLIEKENSSLKNVLPKEYNSPTMRNVNLGELTHSNSLELLSDSILNKLRGMKDKNIAAEVLSRAIKTSIGDIGKVNLTLQEKFSTKFNKIVDLYNERTDMADIEKIIEEMIQLKKEIEEEMAKGNEYDLSPEEKAFFDALGADPEIKKLMEDETLVTIAKELVELINENLTLDAFKREDARARIRSNIRRLLIKYNYPPIKREGAVEKVIKQAELKYSSN